MTQVSRIPLRKEVEQRVYEVLMESVAAAKSHDTVSRLLDDLLSPTERLMIAKRLSIALLLYKHYSQRTISKWLRVSLTTVNKVSFSMQIGQGGYRSIIESILRNEELKGFIQKIEIAIGELFLPKTDRRHWTDHELKLSREKKKAF